MTPERYQRVISLFQAASELQGTHRTAFIDQACAGDPELRREVESLLGQNVSGEGLLDRPLWSPPKNITTGAQVGSYILEVPLGEGGMGVVYRARDTKLNRPVAVKFLSDELADAAARRRFQREAQLASSLNHPHILTVHDAGEFDGRQYLVTEFVDGGTLRDWARVEKRNWRQVVELLVGVADGLACAHEAGMLHRDIKPENVLVTKSGYAKLADFGLAKLLEVTQGDVTRTLTEKRTSPGAIIGTIAYMSPEQASGKTVDTRSDIFSFGIMLYELLDGKRPFQGATDLEVLQNVIHGAMKPLSEELPVGLRIAVEKALTKDPADRYQSMRDLVVDLRKSARLSSEATASSGTAWRGFSRRQAITGTGALLALAAGGAGIYWRANRPQQFDSLAVLPLTNATGDPENDYISEGISESVINRLSQTKLKVTARTTAFRFKQTEKDLDPVAVGKQLKVAAVLTGRITKQGNNVVVSAEVVNVSDGTETWGDKFVRPPGEVQVFEEEIARNIAEALRLRLTKEESAQIDRRGTANTEAYRLYVKGKYYWNKFSEDGFGKAIEYFNQALEKDPSYALAQAGIATSYGILAAETLRPTKEVMPEAKAAADKAVKLDDSLADGHTALGIYNLFYAYDWKAAEAELRRALTLEANNLDALHFYGHYLEVVGRSEEAVSVMRRAMELDPLALMINAEYGYALYHARRFTEAIQAEQKALEMDRNFAYASWMLASALRKVGRVEEAVAAAERARATGWAAILIDLACSHGAAGRPQEAHKLLSEAMEIGTREFVDPGLMAMAYGELHERDEAFRWLEKAYDERSAMLAFLKGDPGYDPLRSDARFTELLRRVNLG